MSHVTSTVPLGHAPDEIVVQYSLVKAPTADAGYFELPGLAMSVVVCRYTSVNSHCPDHLVTPLNQQLAATGQTVHDLSAIGTQLKRMIVSAGA
jgi:hypothetical protein